MFPAGGTSVSLLSAISTSLVCWVFNIPLPKGSWRRCSWTLLESCCIPGRRSVATPSARRGAGLPCLWGHVRTTPVPAWTRQQSPRICSTSLIVLQEDGWMLRAPACAAIKLMPLLIQLLSYPVGLTYLWASQQKWKPNAETLRWDLSKSFFFSSPAMLVGGEKKTFLFL